MPPSHEKMHYHLFVLALLTSAACPLSSVAHANPREHSSMLTGPLGLNTVPNARMDVAGTAKIGVSTLDPYLHGYIGFQIAKPLYINIRQSAEFSSLGTEPDRLYPGVDLKLRLLEETRSRPEIAIGLQSAIGHKRMAGEYLALSKRYKDFDFTGGIGWGRYGSAGHFDNPLGAISNHFSDRRTLDGESPNQASDWFTGDKVGLFGGIEYFTPLDGLSLKFDWGADRYSAETAAGDYNAPAPWALGLSYQPTDWASLSLAMQGTDKIMGRLDLKGLVQNWRTQDAQSLKPSDQPFRPFRTGLTLPDQMEISAANEGAMLSNTRANENHARATLALKEFESSPFQIGRAVKHMANHAGQTVEAITVTPTVMNLQGPSVTMLRSDFENAAAKNRGSPEEIWQNTEFDTGEKSPFNRHSRQRERFLGFTAPTLILDNHFSLAEEDSNVLARSSLIAGARGPTLFGFLDNGFAARLNIADNLERIRQIRPNAVHPVRSNVDEFAERRLSIEHSYLAFTHSFRSDLHLSLIGGYLEEMYAGAGAEILYRPFGSRLALGAEIWDAVKRNPYSSFNGSFTNDKVVTGHLNAWYDLPHHDITLGAKFGRFLGEDVGAQFTLSKNFENGASLEGFVTLSNKSDYDLFGGTTHSYNGVRLTLPFGGFKYMPRGAQVRTEISPFGRDIGQSIKNPIPLYEITEPFSYSHMQKNWNKIIPR